MSTDAPNSSDARFSHLVKRALFELRLAKEIAVADGYEPQIRALVEGARGNLRRCLRLVEPATGRESEVRSQESSGDECGA